MQSFPQVFCINARKMVYFGRNMQVFRTIHRVFHSFAHIQKRLWKTFLQQSFPFDKRAVLWYNNKNNRKLLEENACGVMKQKIIASKPFICHPERSRNFSERKARRNRGATATKGSPNKFGWLAITNVTFPLKGYLNSKRDPAAAFALRFCIVNHSAKVRLRSG